MLNETLSLICGTGLDSNPQATITWIAPDGTTIVDNARFNLGNGPDIIRLNFTHVVMSDMGVWRCNINTESERHVQSGSKLVLLDAATIGLISVNIQLIIISKLTLFFVSDSGRDDYLVSEGDDNKIDAFSQQSLIRRVVLQ